MWKPAAAATFFLLISFALAGYAAHSFMYLDAERSWVDFLIVIGCPIIAGVIFVGAGGYLAAAPGLTAGHWEGRFRTKDTFYGRIVNSAIENCGNSCSVGYVFGFKILGTVMGMAFIAGAGYLIYTELPSFLLNFTWEMFWERTKIALIILGIIVAVVITLITIAFIHDEGLTTRVGICKDREF